jgi:crotonobetainyl-CoA:carnitine CoA-transferase CaiB-like acyl-CoA transferase
MPAMTKWLSEEGMLGAFEPMKEWGYDDWLMRDTSSLSQEEFDACEDTLTRFFTTKSKAELYEQASKRRIMLYPSSTTKDLVENAQLKEREFYSEVEHPELGETITYVGAPYKMTETPWKISRRAPLIGEHNEEVYEGELGFSKEELRLFKEAGVI